MRISVSGETYWTPGKIQNINMADNNKARTKAFLLRKIYTWNIGKQEENDANCNNLFNCKKKKTDKCMHAQSPFGNVPWNFRDTQIQALLLPTSSFLTSEARQASILMHWRTMYTFSHVRGFKIHYKYIKIIYASGSAHVNLGVWIKAGPQPLFLAEPDVKNGWADPNSISCFELIQSPYFAWT